MSAVEGTVLITERPEPNPDDGRRSFDITANGIEIKPDVDVLYLEMRGLPVPPMLPRAYEIRAYLNALGFTDPEIATIAASSNVGGGPLSQRIIDLCRVCDRDG